MKVKVWTDENDVTEVDAPERADPISVVRAWVNDRYDDDWSDHVTVFLQADGLPARSFDVLIHCEVRFNVSERRARK